MIGTSVSNLPFHREIFTDPGNALKIDQTCECGNQARFWHEDEPKPIIVESK